MSHTKHHFASGDAAPDFEQTSPGHWHDMVEEDLQHIGELHEIDAQMPEDDEIDAFPIALLEPLRPGWELLFARSQDDVRSEQIRKLRNPS